MSALPIHAPQPRPATEPGKVIQFPGAQPVPIIDDPTSAHSCGWSLATEDYDPTPVPDGCHSCWLTGGGKCMSCPLRGASARPAPAAP